MPGSPPRPCCSRRSADLGLQPFPLLFVEQKDFVWGLIASMYLGQHRRPIIVLTCVPLFAAIAANTARSRSSRRNIISDLRNPCYTVHNRMLDIWLMLLFGVIGYVFRQLDYPLAPLVPRAGCSATALKIIRQSMIISQGEVRVFFSNWLVGKHHRAALVMLFWPLIGRGLAHLRARP